MDSVYDTQVLPVWVAPFGYLRINAYLPLPVAFRSLSRPSSASGAKAFPLRPFVLNLLFRSLCGFSSFEVIFSLPQNCSISTQIQEKLYLIFKNTFLLSALLLLCFLLHIVQFSRYIFGLTQLNLSASHRRPHPCGCGGLKWTRTIDLALIRRAL